MGEASCLLDATGYIWTAWEGDPQEEVGLLCYQQLQDGTQALLGHCLQTLQDTAGWAGHSAAKPAYTDCPRAASGVSACAEGERAMSH